MGEAAPWDCMALVLLLSALVMVFVNCLPPQGAVSSPKGRGSCVPWTLAAHPTAREATEAGSHASALWCGEPAAMLTNSRDRLRPSHTAHILGRRLTVKKMDL